MGEVRTKIKAIRIDMICDDCCDGHMIFHGVVQGNKTKYEHLCDNCLAVGVYDMIYPRIEKKK